MAEGGTLSTFAFFQQNAVLIVVLSICAVWVILGGIFYVSFGVFKWHSEHGGYDIEAVEENECTSQAPGPPQGRSIFIRFMTAVAARTGQQLNYANIASELDVSEVTVKEWISILEKSGVVYILKPYKASVLNRAVKTPKLYFRDTGLCCYLTRWLTPETLKNGAMAGAMFETFVINEILKSYSNEGLDYDFDVYYYNGKDKKKKDENGKTVEVEGEIDLIIQENGILYPIEIKMSTMPKAAMASEFDVLDGVPDKKRGMGAIICLIDRKLYLRENLVALPLEYL